MSQVRYPNITVKRKDEHGDTDLLGEVMKALRNAKVNQQEINTFFSEATKNDYSRLVQTVMKWVNVE